MTNKYEVMDATRSGLEEMLKAFRDENYPDNPGRQASDELLLENFDNGSVRAWMVCCEGHPVSMQMLRPDMEVCRGWTHPDHRGKGLCRALLRVALAAGGYWCYVLPSNNSSWRMLDDFHPVVVGTIPVIEGGEYLIVGLSLD